MIDISGVWIAVIGAVLGVAILVLSLAALEGARNWKYRQEYIGNQKRRPKVPWDITSFTVKREWADGEARWIAFAHDENGNKVHPQQYWRGGWGKHPMDAVADEVTEVTK